MKYNSKLLYHDVCAAISNIHSKMHEIVKDDISKYLDKDDKLLLFFQRLKKYNK